MSCSACHARTADYAAPLTGHALCLRCAYAAIPRSIRNVLQLGSRVGLLRVIGYSETRNRHVYWLAECDCGARDDYRGDRLLKGRPRCCGALECSLVVASRFGWRRSDRVRFVAPTVERIAA